MFQSLFLWNLPSDIFHSNCLMELLLVSILVFVELALGRSYTFRLYGLCMVSILVFVELALGPAAGHPGICTIQVSILVFVELALGLVMIFISFYLQCSFNPCFCGTCPRTSRATARRWTLGIVSILVFVELALGLYGGYRSVECWSFNPCFTPLPEPLFRN